PPIKVPGRKRGRPPIRKLEFQSHYMESMLPLKVPKKRGRKPGFKLKPRIVMPPLANSPPSSTPEPEMGSLPQDAAIVPKSATPQTLSSCLAVKRYTGVFVYARNQKRHFRYVMLRVDFLDSFLSLSYTYKIYCSETVLRVFETVAKTSSRGATQTHANHFSGEMGSFAANTFFVYGGVLCGCMQEDGPGTALKPPNSTIFPRNQFCRKGPSVRVHLTCVLAQSRGESPVPDDFLCEPLVDSKRYSVDPGDSAFSVTTSQYVPKNPYSYRGSSCSLPAGLCRRASSPGRFHDGSRNASCGPAYSPDSGECKRPAGKDPSSWGVEEVVSFIKDADPQALGPHADTFRRHEIDGDALLLLKSEMMMKYLGLKLGPALKLSYHIDNLKQSRP
uniref:Scm polycomb group protein like 4 n=1 Tax=Tetraodon nigroviridis TaxID=99883 RepID=H3DFW1_TETNG